MRKKIGWIVAALLLGLVILAVACSGGGTPTTPTPNIKPTTATPTATPPSPSPTTTTPSPKPTTTTPTASPTAKPTSTTPAGPPTIPANHVGRTTCAACHATGVAGAPKLPASPDHTKFTDALASCQACHKGP
ncbi:MAG: hypothetical protein Q7R57_04895 [Dehalococcoidales bacterium]|nr:hypothetical protein [Dehalococcoidales bacterium]